MRVSKLHVVKVGWMTASIAVLAWALWRLNIGELNETREYEIGLANFIYMGALSFPLGPIVLFVFGRAIDTIAPSWLGDNSFAEVLVVWIACAVGGYIQWFIIVPSVYRELKKKLK